MNFLECGWLRLKRMTLIGKKNMHLEENPQKILDDIQMIVLQQQNEFHRIWEGILEELEKEKIIYCE